MSDTRDKSPPAVETTHEEAMKRLLSLEKYSDMILKGNDGVEVPAARCLLAARSNVFDGMLYGKFAEAKNTTVELPYSGAVLNELVKYIYTDKIDESFCEEAKLQERLAAKLIGLMEAGHFFGLEVLVQKVTAVAKSLMTFYPKTAIVCLRFCEESSATGAENLIMDCLRADPASALLDNPSIALLSESKIRKFVNDVELDLDELSFFNIINTWVQFDASDDGGIEGTLNAGTDNRKHRATELTDCLALERIDPEALATTVASSGIIPQQRLYETFKTQALMAVKRHGVSFMHTRKPTWTAKSAKYFSTFMLNSPPMRTGIHKWKVLVEKACLWIWVGVASSEDVVDEQYWLGSERSHGWVYGSNGSACTRYPDDGPDYAVVHPTFDSGDTVTLTLNLNEECGKLSASVNQGDSFVLFKNMLDNFGGSGGPIGFVPAVSLRIPGKVRFLGFIEDEV
ncbi:MAG: hypothetical protein SGARI_002659 [Bacillariaceae sp.]